MNQRILLFAILPLLFTSCTQIYWSDHGYPAAIQHTSWDGKTTKPVIVQQEVNGWPRSPFTLAYDRKSDRLLWQDLKGHAIKSVDRATGKLGDWEVALKSAGIPNDLCVDQTTRTVYFTVMHLEIPRTYSIQSASLEDGGVRVVVPKSRRVINTVDFDAARNALTYTMSNSVGESFGVWRHRLRSGKSEQIVQPREQSRGALRCALGSSGNLLFWTRNDSDNKLDGVWAMDLSEDGIPKHLVKSPGTYPFEIECRRTWTGNPQLVWIDITLGAILKSNADGEDRQTIVDIKKSSLGKYPTALELVR